MPRLLLTAFEPFADLGVNPSQKILEAIAKDAPANLITALLPTVFAEAGAQIRQLIREQRPDAVIMLGVAAGRKSLNLERFALNINDASVPDNSGKLASGLPIVADGPAAYRATLPLEPLYERLNAEQIPVSYSNHAGAYVCNHVFYCARHEIETLGLNIPCGFIHVPMMREASDQRGADVGLPLVTMIQGIRHVLAALGQPQTEGIELS